MFGYYQYSFRPGQTTIDQIFTLKTNNVNQFEYKAIISSSPKVLRHFFKTLDNVRGFRKGKTFSCFSFNIFKESVLRKARLHINGTIFGESVQLLAFSNNIGIIRRTKRDFTSA